MSRLTPFRIIVIGAILGCTASFVSASMSLAFALLVAQGSASMLPFGLFETGYGVAVVVAPVASFLVVYGIAKAARPQQHGLPGPPSDPAPHPEPAEPVSHMRSPRWTPFKITLIGAAVFLTAGLAIAGYQISRYLFPASMSGTDFASYEVTSGTILFLGTVGSAIGGLLAFYGIALAFRART